jgi:hypothetical protein
MRSSAGPSGVIPDHRPNRRDLRLAGLVERADDVSVHASQLLVGIGLFVWGMLVAFLGWWIAWDPVRAGRVGERRWRIDRGMARRRGLSRDQWLDRWASSQRTLAQWIGIPFLILWCTLSVWMIVKGLGG